MLIKLLLCLSIFATTASFSASIIVLQGETSEFGRKFFSGFSSVTTESMKAFQYHISKDRAILDQIKSLRPDLVVTIGKAPIEALVTLLPSTPFIVGDYFSPALAKKPNVVVMEQTPPTDAAIDLLLKFLPNVKTIGTIYNPQYSQDIFNLLVKSATKRTIRIASIKASNASDVGSYVSAFIGKIDVYFAIRDVTTSNLVASDALFDFSKKNQIPVVSLDSNHQTRPALVTLAVDPVQLGTEAWEIAKIILKEKKIPQLPPTLDASELSLGISLTAVSMVPTGMQLLPKFLQDTTDANYSVRVNK